MRAGGSVSVTLSNGCICVKIGVHALICEWQVGSWREGRSYGSGFLHRRECLSCMWVLQFSGFILIINMIV